MASAAAPAASASSPAPASSARPTATPTDKPSAPPPAAAAAAPPPLSSPPPAAPPPSSHPLAAPPRPTAASPPPPPPPVPPRTPDPRPLRPSPSPPALSPPAAPPPSAPPPKPVTPPRAPVAHPPESPAPASPPTTAPPAVKPPAPRSHRPSLPTPATAADPARPASGRSPSTNKSLSPGAPSRSSSAGLKNGANIGIIAGITVIGIAFIVVGIIWLDKKFRRGRNGYRPGFMSPTSSFSSQHPSGDTANAGSSIHPSVQTSYSAGSPGLKPCVSDMSMGNSRFFTYEELYQITEGFSARNLLGEGGFGSVYKGSLPDGKDVAVKQLKDGGGQGEREFQAEVEIISRVHHRHLVSLVGHCIFNDQRLLVYDFVPNNSLHYHLHGHGRPVLEWCARIKIAAGAARGIAYLHEDCHPRIIHRDIKSSNILLDNDFEAKVADFGLARLALDAVTHVTTRVMGTFGYMAPEYASSGKLTEKSDVFSFGVVLLELITGRKPVDASRPLGDESLVEWARPKLSRALDTGDLEGLIDPRLNNNFNEVEMFRMIEAAAACIRHSSSRRPRMSQVVRVLNSLAEIDLTNGVQPGQSELFNVANTADIRMFQRMVAGVHDDSTELSQYSWSSRSRGGTDAAPSSRIL